MNQNKGAWQSAFNPLSIAINCRSPRFARNDDPKGSKFSPYNTVRAGPNHNRQYSVTQQDPPKKAHNSQQWIHNSIRFRAGLTEWLKFQRSRIEPARTGVVEEGTDYGAIKQGFITATTLHVSMTDDEKLEGLIYESKNSR